MAAQKSSARLILVSLLVIVRLPFFRVLADDRGEILSSAGLDGVLRGVA
jgi:hypothetical protein